MTLHKKTMRLVKKTKRPTKEICKAAKVGVRWYNKFKTDTFPDPGVNKVERVFDELSRKIK